MSPPRQAPVGASKTAAQVLLSPAVGSGVASGAGASRASAILHDRQTPSMLQTEQHLPRLGSQSGTVEANLDGSTDIYFGPTAPEGKANNWLQTVPGKGGGRSCAFITPRPASSTRPGSPPRSNRSDTQTGHRQLKARLADR
jgi:hypothetical protein